MKNKNHTKPKKMRIFLGLSEVAGFYYGLEQGFKQLGIAVTRFDLGNHPFNYADKKENLLVRLFQKSNFELKKKLWHKIFWKCIALHCKAVLFIWVLFRHDVFIFSYGTSFFRLADLKILKFFRKKILFQFHGSDSRPPYMDGTVIYQQPTNVVAKMTVLKKRQLTFINQYADAIIDIPTMGLFHEKPFINWLRVGLTVSITQAPNYIAQKNKNNEIKILHAPSHPQAKGTSVIKQTITNLKHAGYPINFIELHNQPHYKVKEALMECDFVIDQLFADYPMPGFATESAWFSKPTIICGYATSLWHESLPDDERPPSYYCHPDELEQAIRLFCDDDKFRTELGKKAHQFVSQHWAPKEVAKRYLRVINNDIPTDWLCFPEHISYIHGCGVSENFLQNFLNKFLTEQGTTALQLHDKPELLGRFNEFVNHTQSHAE